MPILESYQKNFEGHHFTVAKDGVIAMYIVRDGDIENIRVMVDEPSPQDSDWEVTHNDIVIASATIPAGLLQSEDLDLNVAVLRFDRLLLNLKDTNGGQVYSPVALQVDVNETFILPLDPLLSEDVGGVLFTEPDGPNLVLAQDRDAFFYDKVFKTLYLADGNYTNPALLGWNALASLTIGDNAMKVINGISAAGMKIDLWRGQTAAGANQTSGLKIRVRNGSVAGSGNISTAVEAFCRNDGNTTGNAYLQGLEGVVQPTESCSVIVGCETFTTSEGTGAGKTIGTVYGFRASCGAAASWTVTNVFGQQLNVNLDTAVVENAYGLQLNRTGGSNLDQSYAIFISNSWSTADVNAWTIYSLSTAPSFFNGHLIVPAHAYGVDWDGNLSVPTKDAVYEAVNALTTIVSGHTTTLGTHTGEIAGHESRLDALEPAVELAKVESFIVALSDLATPLQDGVTDVPVAYFHMPYDFRTLPEAGLPFRISVYSSDGLVTSPDNITVDIHKNNVSVFDSDILSIEAGEVSSVPNGTVDLVNTPTDFAEGDVVLFKYNLDTGLIPVSGLIGTIIGYRI